MDNKQEAYRNREDKRFMHDLPPFLWLPEYRGLSEGEEILVV